MSKKRNSKQQAIFTKEIAICDGYCCQGISCCGSYMLSAHHILFLSHGGLYTADNGILLCQSCHDRVHGRGNYHIKGKRITGRQFMIMILDRLVNKSNYRWATIHEYLKRKEGVM